MLDPFHKALQKAFPSAMIIAEKYHGVHKLN
ncbi:hypothetical protein ACFTQL_29325 [Peribacillus butanolivorans]